MDDRFENILRLVDSRKDFVLNYVLINKQSLDFKIPEITFEPDDITSLLANSNKEHSQVVIIINTEFNVSNHYKVKIIAQDTVVNLNINLKFVNVLKEIPKDPLYSFINLFEVNDIEDLNKKDYLHDMNNLDSEKSVVTTICIVPNENVKSKIAKTCKFY